MWWQMLLAAALGLVIGSFTGALVVRWPHGESIIRGRSKCDHCRARLGVVDLIPLVSALMCRGKCRYCGVDIDPVHHYAEVSGLVIGLAALGLHLAELGAPAPAWATASGWTHAIFGWMLLPLALLDARHMWLPDRLIAPLALVGLLLGGVMFDSSLFANGVFASGMIDRLGGAIAGGLTLALIAAAFRTIRRAEGMGGGDPKLMAAIGAWLGWQALAFVLLLASAGGIIWALMRYKKGEKLAQKPVSFGFFLCLAGWLAVPLLPLLSIS